jgi:S-adenosylmethionine/arginine decarboxylase-like enzyme
MGFDHKHLIVNCLISKPPTDVSVVNDWLSRLVVKIDMQQLMAPRSIRCMTEGNEGITGDVVIETSHVAIHIWEKSEIPMIRLCLYSCKYFNEQHVFEMLDEFGILEYGSILLDRNSCVPAVLIKQEVDRVSDKIVFNRRKALLA